MGNDRQKSPEIRTPRVASILIVDDDPSVCRLLSEMLQPVGYRLVTCSDAEEVSAVAEDDGPFDLVITDVSLPDCSGPELVDRLRRLDPNLKALLISGGERVRGDLPFLAKPFTAATLRRRVEELLEQKQ